MKMLLELRPGDSFMIGEFPFIVLGHNAVKNETLVLSKEFLYTSRSFGLNPNYAESSLKERIDSIVPMIEEKLGADSLIEHEVDLVTVDMQRPFPPCKCKVRPLTFDEAREYNSLITYGTRNDRQLYWSCTPWSTAERAWANSVVEISTLGSFGRATCDSGRCVRVACYLKSNILVVENKEEVVDDNLFEIVF